MNRISSNRTRLLPHMLAVLLATGVGACTAASASSDNRESFHVPDPTTNLPAPSQGMQQAVLAGGCFWGLEAVFDHVDGVKKVEAGYAGGTADTATYGQVSSGDTGHAESVKITYDPAKVSYGQLLKVYFSVAHNPTQLNRQGPDTGMQYRSEIFYGNDQQRQVAQAYIKQLGAAKVYGAPIVTKLEPLKAFYKAEAYHQNYAELHPNDPYIVYNDAPKVVHLKQMLPKLYRADQTVVEVQLR